MIAVLPMLLYPILGVGVLQFALGFLRKQNTVGIYGSQYLPGAGGVRPHPVAAASWLSLTPVGNPLGTVALVQASQFVRGSDYPPLLVDSDGKAYNLTGKTAFSLCRCGGSVSKPFCDGTHTKIGFQAAEAAVQAEQQQQKS